MPKAYQNHKETNVFSDNIFELASHFPDVLSEVAVEEWLNYALVMARSALNADLSFFFSFDQDKKELTANLSQDREGEPRWQKVQWQTGEEVAELFADCSSDRKIELNRLLSPLLKHECSSILFCPVKLTANDLGLIGVGSFESKVFPANAEVLLELISHNITNLWQNDNIMNPHT